MAPEKLTIRSDFDTDYPRSELYAPCCLYYVGKMSNEIEHVEFDEMYILLPENNCMSGEIEVE
jgi:hypothetical protein